MRTYMIPNDLQMPLYQYVYQCLRNDIRSGNIKPKEKLPSKRMLAKQLQVSLITIENAYSQLEIEGYITAIEKKGYFVNRIDVVSTSYEEYEHGDHDEVKEEYEIDLTRSALSADDFPFTLWQRLSRKIMSERKQEILNPTSYKGSALLREAIVHHLKGFCNMDVQPEQIILGAGSEYLYSLLVQFFGKEQIYGLEDPGHHAIASVYKANEVEYRFIPLDEQGIDVSHIENQKVDIIHVSPNHHYPTGITMPISRRYELLRWAIEKNGYIIEDDYDSEFRLKGKPIGTLFQLDQNNRVIYINTFSITLSSSFRMAYMVLPQRLVKKYEDKLSFYHCTIPAFEQLVLASFISEGGFERHINRMRKHYRENRDILVESIQNSNLPIEVREADSGLHFLLKYPYKIADEEVEKIAGEMGLHIYSLSHFMHHKKNSQTIIIRYTGLNRPQCYRAVELLVELFEKLATLEN